MLYCGDLRNYARAFLPRGRSALVGTTATRIKDVLFSEQSVVAVLGRTRTLHKEEESEGGREGGRGPISTECLALTRPSLLPSPSTLFPFLKLN